MSDGCRVRPSWPSVINSIFRCLRTATRAAPCSRRYDTDILFSVWSLTAPCKGLHSLVLPLRGCVHFFASFAPLREKKKQRAQPGGKQATPANVGVGFIPILSAKHNVGVGFIPIHQAQQRLTASERLRGIHSTRGVRRLQGAAR